MLSPLHRERGPRSWALTPRHLSFSSVVAERLRSHQALVGNAGPGLLEF